MDNETSDISFLETPDTYLGLFTPEQIKEEYPNQFVNTEVSKTPISFEVSPLKQERRDEYTERFFFTKNNVFTLKSDRFMNIWDLDMTDYLNLDTLTSKAIALSVTNSGSDKPKENTFTIPKYNRTITITHLPPTPDSSKYIKDTLDRRKKLLQE
ncbi:hypothetical protein A3K02_02095 [candidate division WS6 bacterium RIFOXYD1_FULL_33_8]|uniref:Uncharacterized protein n=2 Tax=Candidatus Dojkabacteria TaxID=74243 RepID=A0A0G0ADS7_9BACT|nr:MAG: hypothetical protein UR32_C0019G0024 [candidate division WS6 bacterium GW2011_GWE2_33_157]KKP43849.1 MAG: hypothetical protein UR34_C0010G0014 [candidate division WS6 bacterium GW2011_GWC1_33_20]KKP44360.1 MAG: hypothetical protein UR36_C0018G0025 [candidate division WS6 bacterium GW2011_GWF1_33_233]KKP54845.1 MAG: hypothetical protein UR45_C0008G0023 [candidate division WS6 bacterium GW2011_WS6_33_547]KKP54969.1 MAG: hypothetical protein UR47_C0007G0027 [candidate division WS6 bacteriu